MNIFELEKKYKEILENIEEWGYLRISMGHKLKNSSIDSKSIRKSDFIWKKIKKLKSMFYGFKYWFKNYEYLFFSDSGQRVFIEGKYYDKLMDYIIEKIGNEKVLMIEKPNTQHYSFSQIDKKYIVSRTIIDFISRIVRLMDFNKNNLSNLNKLLELNNIDFKYESTIKLFNAKYFIYKILLKLYKPKKVFIVCHYCLMPLVKACNDLNIIIIEVQHGIINKEHFGYVSHIKLNKDYKVHYLLSFGKNETQIKDIIISNVVPVGSFYLEYLQTSFKSNIKMKNLTKKYQYTIGVSLQDSDWEFYGLLDFLKTVAIKNKNLLFLLIPRRRIENIRLPNNMMFYTDLDCYNTILHCNIHCTIYSSCALEAPTLGIPNLMVNIENFAKKYYSNILSSKHTKYVENNLDFIKYVQTLSKIDKKIIQLENQDIFYRYYKTNINNFLKIKNIL